MHASDDVSPLSMADQARRVVALTASAWRLPPASAAEIARRMPHGYVPIKRQRRLQQIAARPFNWPAFTHSW